MNIIIGFEELKLLFFLMKIETSNGVSSHKQSVTTTK
jgi:hypothetical protein